jgi:hypothetical protein
MFRMGSNAEDVVQVLEDMTRSAIPAASAEAINWLAFDVRTALKEEMGQVFDRPTPTTLNAMLVDRATPQRLLARVWLKDVFPKGTPPVNYLGPQIVGGVRRLKRHERALQAIGAMPQGMWAVPTKAAPLNAHGNLTGAWTTSMLSALGANPDAYSNRTKRSAKRRKGRSSFFVMRDRDGRAVGIAQRKGSEARLVIAYVRQPKYTPRLDFQGVGARVIAENQAGAMRRALRKHLKTVRP